MREYDAIDALNWSTLSKLATSPALMRYRRDNPEPDSAAFRLGRAVHCAILEPEAWPARYAVAPDVDRRTKEGKAAYADFLTTALSIEVLSSGEWDLAERCARAVRSHRVAADLLRGGRAEETVQWIDATTGVACKGRLDYLCPDCVVDLKTTRRATVREFVRDVATFRYHGQVAWYRDGAIAAGLLPPDAEAYILAVQTVEPYDVIAARLSAETMMLGNALWRDLLRRYCECRAADIWPGVAPDLITLDLPPWALDAAALPDEGGTW